MVRSIDKIFERRVSGLVNSGERAVLRGGRKGVEKESLRATPAGKISQTRHPAALGAPLTNENITTTTTKDTALIAKQMPGEAKANVTPANNGPITRPRLNCAEESDTAARTSSRSTRSGNSDCHAAHDAELQRPSAIAR